MAEMHRASRPTLDIENLETEFRVSRTVAGYPQSTTTSGLARSQPIDANTSHPSSPASSFIDFYPLQDDRSRRRRRSPRSAAPNVRPPRDLQPLLPGRNADQSSIATWFS